MQMWYATIHSKSGVLDRDMARPLEPYHYSWLRNHPSRTEEWLRERLADGFHIHHLDGNHSNDGASNLVLMDGQDHLALHGMDMRKPPMVRRGKRKRMSRAEAEFQKEMNRIREAERAIAKALEPTI